MEASSREWAINGDISESGAVIVIAEEVGKVSEINEDNGDMGVATTVSLLTKAAASAPTVEQFASANNIYEGLEGCDCWWVFEEGEINYDDGKLGVSVAVSPSTKEVASDTTVAQPDSSNTISKLIGRRNSSSDGAPHFHDGGEPDNPDAHAIKYTTQ